MMSGQELKTSINMTYPILFTWVLQWKKSLFGNVRDASTILPYLEGESSTYVRILTIAYREEGE